MTLIVHGMTLIVHGMSLIVHGMTLIVHDMTLIVHGMTLIVHGMTLREQVLCNANVQLGPQGPSCWPSSGENSYRCDLQVKTSGVTYRCEQ